MQTQSRVAGETEEGTVDLVRGLFPQGLGGRGEYWEQENWKKKRRSPDYWNWNREPRHGGNGGASQGEREVSSCRIPPAGNGRVIKEEKKNRSASRTRTLDRNWTMENEGTDRGRSEGRKNMVRRWHPSSQTKSATAVGSGVATGGEKKRKQGGVKNQRRQCKEVLPRHIVSREEKMENDAGRTKRQ